MSINVAICSNILATPMQPGHHWVFFNWAAGFKELGCELTWIELDPGGPIETLQLPIENMISNLEAFGISGNILVFDNKTGSARNHAGLASIDYLDEVSLLVNFQYNINAKILELFKKTALINIDPGVLEKWLSRSVTVATHDYYFTIGCKVPKYESIDNINGIKWLFTRPCVSLSLWKLRRPMPFSAFTTVANWWASGGTDYDDHTQETKAHGFQPFLQLPSYIQEKLEITTRLSPTGWEGEVRRELQGHGWLIKDPCVVCPTIDKYQEYIANSKGEFSCAKPAYVKNQTGWISDRTLCYLASGRPAVIQDTGQAKLFDNGNGVFLFSSFDEALECLKAVSVNYAHQSSIARQLAEQYFNASSVAKSFLAKII